MTSYEPPIEDLPIFDSSVFLNGDEPLTYNTAVKKFLKYPSAQGKEFLQEIDVSGKATFNSNVRVLNKLDICNNDISSGIVTVSFNGTQTNNGIVMNNAAITQQGSNSNNVLNTLKRTTITNTGVLNPILSIVYDPSNSGINQTNNGINMTNCAIQQTGGSISLITNNFGTISLAQSCNLTVNSNGSVVNYANDPANVTLYRWSCNNTSTYSLSYFTSTTNVTTNLINVNRNNSINVTIPMTTSASMPVASDSSTRIPTTAWVQSAISQGSGSNLQKNSYETIPTSISDIWTTGIKNFYNTGGRIGYSTNLNVNLNSGGIVSVGYCCGKPLLINIQSTNGLFANGPSQHTPSFSPLSAPIKVKIDVFMYDPVANRTGFTKCTLMILPSACFSLATNNYEGWGKQNSTDVSGNNNNLAYALDNRINGNTSYILTDPTFCPITTSMLNPTVNPLPYPSNTGRQYYSYDYSSSSQGISVLGMLQTGAGNNQIKIWFSGLSDPKNNPTPNTVYDITASIEDASGATSQYSPSSQSGVYLSN